MKYTIYRTDGTEAFTADIDCAEMASNAWKKRLAVLWGIKNGVGLRYINMRGANMCGADMCAADLRDADQRGADMRDVDVHRANMHGTDMRGSKGYILGPQRDDGYRFDLRWNNGAWRVVTGCRTMRNLTTDQYRQHAAGYDCAEKRARTRAILDYLDTIAEMTPTGDET